VLLWVLCFDGPQKRVPQDAGLAIVHDAVDHVVEAVAKLVDDGAEEGPVVPEAAQFPGGKGSPQQVTDHSEVVGC
jgi:hypothetical protein